ncbi:hypothetical protein PHYPSEUDO_013234 [Phytophthora pseudosyringae]|uniref:Myb/SANT-like domain-containing protein n=1 Tax=Phytophthora pseudosyringae TaxID=221518 RepID=A0A8T1W271_9STRA|nr:hypothetical protein PHYPSEUDO_013234 [Phytophthora pseudosyringae]
MDQPAKKQRATWKRSQERLLLQCYLGARNDATLRSDKGIKSKGWAHDVSRLAQDGVAASKDQCKTKYSRIMYEQHDTVKRLKGMSGAGWNSEIQAPFLRDEVWDNLSKTQPRNASLLKCFREEGPDMQDSAQGEATIYYGGHEDQDPPAFSSPSIAERTKRIKRYRDGRKDKSSQVEESTATMTSFFTTAERYFQQMKLLAKELGDQAEVDIE